MTEQQQKKNLRAMLYGLVAGALFMISDWFFDALGPGDQMIGTFVHKNWLIVPMWRYEVSIILAFLAMPLYWIAVHAMMRIVELGAATEDRREQRWVFVYRCGAASACIGFYFIHFLCCLQPILFKLLYEQNLNTEAAALVINTASKYAMIPFVVYFIVADLNLSLGMIHFINRGIIKAPKFAMLFTPLATIVLSLIFKFIPLWICKDISTAFESMGHLLMFVSGFIHMSVISNAESTR